MFQFDWQRFCFAYSAQPFLFFHSSITHSCKVPQHYSANKALGKWVAKQREQYRLLQKGQHSFLTPYRLEKLNECGFCWAARTSSKDAVAVALQQQRQQQQQAAAAARHGQHEGMQDFSQVKDETAVDEGLGEVGKEDFVLDDTVSVEGRL